MERYNEAIAGTLLVKTLELLEKSDKPLQDIYAETGLPYHWLRSVSQGKTNKPSVNRVQYLYEYLSEKQLAI